MVISRLGYILSEIPYLSIFRWIIYWKESNKNSSTNKILTLNCCKIPRGSLKTKNLFSHPVHYIHEVWSTLLGQISKCSFQIWTLSIFRDWLPWVNPLSFISYYVLHVNFMTFLHNFPHILIYLNTFTAKGFSETRPFMHLSKHVFGSI